MTRLNKAGFALIIAIIIATTVAYGAVHQPVIAFTYFLIAGLVLIWAIDAFRSKAAQIPDSLLQVPLLVAAVYGFVQIVPVGFSGSAGGIDGIAIRISIEPFATQVSAVNFVALLLFFSLCLIYLNSVSRLKTLAAVIMIFGFCYAFFAVLQSVLSPDSIFGVYKRNDIDPFGTFVSRNNFAAWIDIALGIPIGLLFAGAVGKDRRLLYATAVAIMGTALLLCRSRGGLAAFVAEVLFIAFLTFRGKGTRSLVLRLGLAVGIFVSIVAGAVFVGGDTTFSRIGLQDTGGPVVTRPHMWSVAIKVIGDSLPLGAGLGTFGSAYTKFDQSSGLYRVEQAHNDYLQAVTDAGVIGGLLLILFAYFLVKEGRAALKVRDKFQHGLAVGCLGSILSIAIQSLFDFPLHTMAISLFFLLTVAILVACTRKYPEPDTASE